MRLHHCDLYIFNHDLTSYQDYKQKYPNLKALWYDGYSALIEGLESVFAINTMIVEESIRDKVIEYIDSKKINIVEFSAQKISTSTKNEKEVCFFPSNDTHVHSFKNVVPLNPRFVFKVSSKKKENAEKVLDELKLPYDDLSVNNQDIRAMSGIVVGNDWGWLEKYVLNKFIRFSIPTFCLQESVIDFGDSIRRMQWCDYPLIQGIATLKFFSRNIYFLTGNPRYESLKILPLNEKKLAAINCNFTYGIFTEIGEHWIKSAVEACEAHKLDYIILQHPRDTTDLSKFNHVQTNAQIVHSYLEKCTFLISRFSSVIHECMSMGRPVIYYNPHMEHMFYDFEPDQSHLLISRSEIELHQAIEKILKETIPNLNNDLYFEMYKTRHTGSGDGLASNRVAQVIDSFSSLPLVKSDRRISIKDCLMINGKYHKIMFIKSLKDKLRNKILKFR